MGNSSFTPKRANDWNPKLKRLSLQQVQRIDDFLTSLGDYGEVHLIVQNGELRYINTVESHKAWMNKQDELRKE